VEESIVVYGKGGDHLKELTEEWAKTRKASHATKERDGQTEEEEIIFDTGSKYSM